MPDAGIFDPLARLQYIKYWEEKRAELDAAMKQIGQIMNVLADMNTLTPEMHQGTDFEQLYTQLAASLQV
jgi:internalin A